MYTSRKVRLKLTEDQIVKLHVTVKMAYCVYNDTMTMIDRYYMEHRYVPENFSLICMFHRNSKLNKWTQSFSDYIVHHAIVDASDDYKEHVINKHEKVPFKSLDRNKFGFTLGKPTVEVGSKYIFIEGLISKNKRAKENLLLFTWKNAIPKNERLVNPKIYYDGLSFYLTFCVETNRRYLATPKTEGIGIDVGLKTLATLSNGVTYGNVLRSGKVQHILNRLIQLKKEIDGLRSSCTIDGEALVSSNRLHCVEQKFKSLSRHLRNIEHNFLHEVSKKIILSNPAFIAVETLDINAMRNNKDLAFSVQHTALSTFLHMLEYKAKLYNIPFIKIEQSYPSSKICSFCGHVKKVLPLNERTYVCEACGFKIDRDMNAAVNLYKKALYITRKLSGCSASFSAYFTPKYRSWMKKIAMFIG